MPLSEFQFIRDYLKQNRACADSVVLGIGDDCAILQVPADRHLLVTMDTLVAGIHFPENSCAQDIGYKCLAVSLSDLAAMGAEPAWVTLALTLPQLDEEWLADFCRGFFQLADEHKVCLVGGDVTRGPLCITTQCHGFVAPGKAMRRSTAAVGDKIYVSGVIGEAALGLKVAQNTLQLPSDLTPQGEIWLQRLNRPTPRVRLGRQIGRVASAAIDISDGLAADLNHILEESGVGAVVDLEHVPVPGNLPRVFDQLSGWDAIIGGGDDFELCFTVAPQHEQDLLQIAESQDCPIYCIGTITAEKGLQIRFNGEKIHLPHAGYEHFA